MTKKQRRQPSKRQHRSHLRAQHENATHLDRMEELEDIAAVQEYERRKAAGEVSYRELSPAEIAAWAGDTTSTNQKELS